MSCLLVPGLSRAELALDRAKVERLDNGLTLIVLEEHSFPVVSVHMLYRVGARNETAGATGLAHFLEHMAFRDSENFPGTGLVSSIYAVGGEWHGYTWLDHTNYFATVPRENLELLLRIEADRMARLLIPAEDIEAERGAVLTELHSYENDPGSVLLDNLMYLTFLAHPYRNNTIGWESDVAHITHAEIEDFYRTHYQPGNAVLAIVGDVDHDAVRAMVMEQLGGLPGRETTAPPHTIEPPQTGERRIRLQGELERRQFRIAWRAPSSNHADHAAMLLVQELLGGGSGVSFLQNDWGTPVREGSALQRAAGATCDDLTTWYPPSAQDYAFVVSGSVPLETDEAAAERAIEQAVSQLRARYEGPSDATAAELEAARQAVLRALVFDVETTEDAAHQLAVFTGLGALDVLSGLPESLRQVRDADIVRVLNRWLGSAQRNIAWYGPPPASPSVNDGVKEAGNREAEVSSPDVARTESTAPNATRAPAIRSADQSKPAGLPVLARLRNGLPVIIHRSLLSPTATLRVVTPWAAFADNAPAIAHQPVWGASSLEYELLPGELAPAIPKARRAIEAATPGPVTASVDPTDPGTVLESYFADALQLRVASPIPRTEGASKLAPMLIVVAGAVDEKETLAALEAGLGDLPYTPFEAPPPGTATASMAIESTLPVTVAQEQLGYVVPAPAPGDPAAPAWQLALYILTHGYEGRLGVEAITRRGLVYYIDSAYRTDGRNGWMTLAIGVDPDKHDGMKALLREELKRLMDKPPTATEIGEAKQHLIGRRISAAQSNPELADQWAREWFAHGKLSGDAEWAQRVNAVTRDEVIKLIPVFAAGSVISIRSP